MLGSVPPARDASSPRPEPPHLVRAAAADTTTRASRRAPAWARRILGVPLAWKLTGVNLIIGLGAAFGVFALHRAGEERWLQLLLILAAALILSLLVSFALVRIALRPLLALEQAADKVWRGDFSARVQNSLLADRDMTRVGNTFNLLLDSIERDRARMRRLASQVIAAQDEERARVARELHDSVAQTMAALVLQLSAAQRKCTDPALGDQLELVRSIAGEALEEVRLLSHTVHPRVLEDLGLTAALEWLARQTREAEGLAIDVRASAVPDALPPVSAAALYRVAQEALRNAARHARARHVP
ncbi:MAG: sensor histidine kinase, partial [Gemmatimonadaceae bacterium]